MTARGRTGSPATPAARNTSSPATISSCSSSTPRSTSRALRSATTGSSCRCRCGGEMRGRSRAVEGGRGRYWAVWGGLGVMAVTAFYRPLPPSTVQSKEVLLATTTSTRDAGLLDSLLPVFERQTGYHVKLIAVGSGQALEL